ncbi:Homeodomain-like domain-containing protein [Halorubrum ezzemoulense]|uniref:Homeodomain-like domain-containing protein n=1 Tax=Halorubrum ezzemoulense TaxID=337243 RepID=A0A238XN97_HALEZ|nr:helix-turn-helix domain-containing protein [Halorubrum ezzemoulense]SNR60455.1 Homeodomain-like domain-containing protein [Halorubrum ezzemoulense]
MPKYKDEQWLREQYLENDGTQEEIASECGVSDSTIHRWRDRFGIDKTHPAQFGIQTDGYEQWKCEAGTGKADTVTVHRLLATLKIDDLSELDGKEVHQKSGEWHNTIGNIEVLTSEEHSQRHARGGTSQQSSN